MFKESFTAFLLEARSPIDYLRDRNSKYYKMLERGRKLFPMEYLKYADKIRHSVVGNEIYKNLVSTPVGKMTPQEYKDRITPDYKEIKDSDKKFVNLYLDGATNRKFYSANITNLVGEYKSVISNIFAPSLLWQEGPQGDDLYEYPVEFNIIEVLGEDFENKFNKLVNKLQKNSRVELLLDFIELEWFRTSDIPSTTRTIYIPAIVKILKKYNLKNISMVKGEIEAALKIVDIILSNDESILSKSLSKVKGNSFPSEVLETLSLEVTINKINSQGGTLELLDMLTEELKDDKHYTPELVADIFRISVKVGEDDEGLDEDSYEQFVKAIKSLVDESHKAKYGSVLDLREIAEHARKSSTFYMFLDSILFDSDDEEQHLTENYFIFFENGNRCSTVFSDQLNHCGSSYDASTMVQICKRFTINKKYWLQAVVSAALNDDSGLLEIHGIGNQKPRKEYYKPIFEFYKKYVNVLLFSDVDLNVSIEDLINYNPEWENDLAHITDGFIDVGEATKLLDDIVESNDLPKNLGYSLEEDDYGDSRTAQLSIWYRLDLPDIFRDLKYHHFDLSIENDDIYYDYGYHTVSLKTKEEFVRDATHIFRYYVDEDSIMDEVKSVLENYMDGLDEESIGRVISTINDMGVNYNFSVGDDSEINMVVEERYSPAIKIRSISGNPKSLYSEDPTDIGIDPQAFIRKAEFVLNGNEEIVLGLLSRDTTPKFYYSSFDRTMENIITESSSKISPKIRLIFREDYYFSIYFEFPPIDLSNLLKEEIDKEYKGILRPLYIIKNNKDAIIERIVDIINSNEVLSIKDYNIFPGGDDEASPAVVVPAKDSIQKNPRSYLDRAELYKKSSK